LTIKKSLRAQIRGWFPQTPNLTIESAGFNVKTIICTSLPFSTLGALMVAASVISAVFGTALVSFYLTLPPLPHDGRILYSGLGGGILSLAAFVVGLYSGILLLARKHILRALTGIGAVFAFGVVTILSPILEGIPAQSGLLVASPMVVFSVIALCIIDVK
jgi:hypothetical protein